MSPSSRACFNEQCLRIPSRVSNVRLRPAKARVALLELIDDAQRLQVVLEAAEVAHALVERVLARVAERRVAEVVREADRLDEILVQAQRARDRAGDLRDLERVREPRAVEVALVVDEHLRLVDETAERRGVNDAVAIALELRAQRRRRLGMPAAARVRGRGGVRREARCRASVTRAARRARRATCPRPAREPRRRRRARGSGSASGPSGRPSCRRA